MRQRLWLQHDGSSALWGKCPTVVESIVSKKVERTSRVDCMASLIAGSSSNGYFLVATPKQARLWSPSQDYGRSRGETSGSCDSCRYQQVKAYFRECPAAHCRLAWTGRMLLWTPVVNYEAPIVWSFDSLRHLTVTCILKSKQYRTYAVQYLWFVY
jgi:hypothetical protein